MVTPILPTEAVQYLLGEVPYPQVLEVPLPHWEVIWQPQPDLKQHLIHPGAEVHCYLAPLQLLWQMPRQLPGPIYPHRTFQAFPHPHIGTPYYHLLQGLQDTTLLFIPY